MRNLVSLPESYEFWNEEYHKKNKSLATLAIEHATYPNKLRRLFIKLGVSLKDKSEAQRDALNSGRAKHPTEGKPRSKEVRKQIGEKLSENWTNLDPKEKDRRIQMTKDYWAAMPDAEKRNLQNKAVEAVRKTGKNGSRLERHLWHQLTLKGLVVEFHKTNLLPNTTMHVDLYLPEIYTVIEVDGPTHFLPIWGEEDLLKKQASDWEKTAAITTSGRYVVRVKHLAKNISAVYLDKIWKKVEEKIDYIKKLKKALPVEKRLMEVSDI